MRIRSSDVAWLNKYLPNLLYDVQEQQISGELSFCAAYERSSGKLRSGDTPDNQNLPTFLCDTFQVSIHLDCSDRNGWPKVYETGGRCQAIAESRSIPFIDLHLYDDDGACCLGQNCAPAGNLTLGHFIEELVIPFLYRLSYVDRFGLETARNDLWGEYSHGDIGTLEYREELRRFAQANAGRNQTCPCGSGQKYKRCHLEEVEAAKRNGLTW